MESLYPGMCYHYEAGEKWCMGLGTHRPADSGLPAQAFTPSPVEWQYCLNSFSFPSSLPLAGRVSFTQVVCLYGETSTDFAFATAGDLISNGNTSLLRVLFFWTILCGKFLNVYFIISPPPPR